MRKTKKNNGLTESETVGRDWYEKNYEKLRRKALGCDFLTKSGRPLEIKHNILTESQVRELVKIQDGQLLVVENDAILLFQLSETKALNTSLKELSEKVRANRKSPVASILSQTGSVSSFVDMASGPSRRGDLYKSSRLLQIKIGHYTCTLRDSDILTPREFLTWYAFTFKSLLRLTKDDWEELMSAWMDMIEK